MPSFNAWAFARAWNSVALAQGSDKSRPALYRSTLIESFPGGVRLVSTDSYILLKAWVPTGDDPHATEPGHDELPDEVAICSDVDGQVVQLMRYAMSKTKGDGDDTPEQIEMTLGVQRPTEQGTLEGLTQSTVSFRLVLDYDQRIESPVYDGAFPHWRPLWFSHQWTQTGLVTFGADGILRLGKLSQLWDRAAIRFELGGSLGVSRITILAPGVNVSGLAMPVRDSSSDESVPGESVALPPSEEGVSFEYGSALDDFLADILKTETPDADDDDVILHARRAQVLRAAQVVIDDGYVSVQSISDALDVSTGRAAELVDELRSAGVVRLWGDEGDAKFDLADDARARLDALTDDDPDADDGGGEPV